MSIARRLLCLLKIPALIPTIWDMSGSLFAEQTTETGNARVFKRITIHFTVLVKLLYDIDKGCPKPSTTSFTAVVTNISMSGLGLESAEAFEVGTYLLVKITVALKTFELPVVVRHCAVVKRPGRKIYSCGVQLVKSPACSEFIPALAKYLIARGLFH